MPKEYAKIRLKTGEVARIVEIMEPNVAFMAEVAKKQGGFTTDTFKISDIASVFIETEEPFVFTPDLALAN